MIKQTYKSKNRNKTTEKQALLSVQAKTETLVETVLSASKVSLAAAASAPNCGSRGLMRLSYSQETVVRGCRQPAAPALLEQPRQMPSAAQVQA
jgi:hypothetical protein